MAELNHDGRRIDVEVIDSETAWGVEYVQVRAVDDGVTLSDAGGNKPWVEADELSDR